MKKIFVVGLVIVCFMLLSFKLIYADSYEDLPEDTDHVKWGPRYHSETVTGRVGLNCTTCYKPGMWFVPIKWRHFGNVTKITKDGFEYNQSITLYGIDCSDRSFQRYKTGVYKNGKLLKSYKRDSQPHTIEYNSVMENIVNSICKRRCRGKAERRYDEN